MSDLAATAQGAMQGAAALAPVFPPIGPIVGAVVGGLTGLFGSSQARKKRNRLRKKLQNQQSRLRAQIPGVQEYFKELESYKKGQITRKRGEALESFVQSTVGTVPTLQRKIAATGLKSGSAKKLLGSTKVQLASGIESQLGDLESKESDLMLSLDQQRKQQLQGIIDQIGTLQTKETSL